jgi:hypothetical protein
MFPHMHQHRACTSTPPSCQLSLLRLIYAAHQDEVNILDQLLQEIQTSLVAACGSMPIALHVVCGVIKHASSAAAAADFLRAYADPQLPFKAHEVRLPCMVGPVQEMMLKAIMTAILLLPEELSTALFALSIIPGGFSRAAASELLGATGSSIHRQGLLQKLARRGLLRYHRHQQLYTMHGVTKAVATALCKGLRESPSMSALSFFM